MEVTSAATISVSGVSDAADLPHIDDVVEGAEDYKGRPVKRSESGGWRSAYFIIAVEVAERFTYNGIACNLITYLTGPLGQSTATAAENANAWSGAASLFPLLGALVADTFLGRYRTIIISSVLYVVGLGLLTLSALFSPDCQGVLNDTPCSPPRFQMVLFFSALYLVAIAQGGHKPCLLAFGADQFDGDHPKECQAKSSFFNWWYFGTCVGSVVSLTILTYIQDNLSWILGFGIPCLVLVLALIIFLLGTVTYRFRVIADEISPFVRIGRVFGKAARNWRTSNSLFLLEEESKGLLPNEGSQQFKFLNKALVNPNGSIEDRNICSLSEVEEAKAILRLFPIWFTCLAYGIVFAQCATLFTKQGVTLDRSIGPNFVVPAASLQSLTALSIVVFIPIYDQIMVPIARSITRIYSGITMLQRIGTGLFLSLLSMVIAGFVEMKRLAVALEHNLVDEPNAILPMSVLWLIPQYLLIGISDIFTVVGLQEFFYDQVPIELKSIGLSLYLSIFGLGSFLSSFIISILEKSTGGDGRNSWFSTNLNKAHLDYFYWLLSALSAVAFAAYLYFVRRYIYVRRNSL